MNTTEKFDAESLLAALRNKDNNAYTYLLKTYGKALLSYAYGFLHNKANADDAICETYTELVAKSHTIRNANALKSWLYKTVKNKALNMLKHNSYQIEVSDDKMEFLINSAGGENREIDELLHIKDCLSKLEPDERRVLFLRQSGVPWNIVPKIMRLSTQNCRTLYKNAIKKFKKLYYS